VKSLFAILVNVVVSEERCHFYMIDPQRQVSPSSRSLHEHRRQSL
jgi:hypothetical protein